ncbi:copper chaperone PCu(A)C [Deinococcus sp.]|uniref:copper chaperone PCu(A)C n=1 Tax=Deinococcus sp. TaxID=47478 RepID=UPI003CC5AA40
MKRALRPLAPRSLSSRFLAAWLLWPTLLASQSVQAQMNSMDMTAPAGSQGQRPSAVRPNVQLSAGWIAAAPPGAEELAAYLTLHNSGSRAVTLVGASSSVSARAMPMLLGQDAAGRETMRGASSLSIAAGGNLVFAPGKAHLMLSGLRRDLKPGESVDVRLTFSDGSAIRAALRVRRL